MRLLDYIEYAVSTPTKFAVSAAIGAALFVVYYWEPRRRKKTDNFENQGVMRYMEIDPKDLAPSPRLLHSNESEKPGSARNDTLEHLDEYVKTLKRHHIRSIDEV